MSDAPKLNPHFRLQFEPAQNAHVLLFPEGMIKLNGSAGAILQRCDGLRTAAEITADCEKTFNATGLAPEVDAFLTIARERGWVL
jgi:pyrroloquinoline quinone biosynthesis protein D